MSENENILITYKRATTILNDAQGAYESGDSGNISDALRDVLTEVIPVFRAERKRLWSILHRLWFEQVHYQNTGVGADRLLAATAHAGEELNKQNSTEALSLVTELTHLRALAAAVQAHRAAVEGLDGIYESERVVFAALEAWEREHGSK